MRAPQAQSLPNKGVYLDFLPEPGLLQSLRQVVSGCWHWERTQSLILVSLSLATGSQGILDRVPPHCAIQPL